MQVAINAIRALIFALSSLCLTYDAATFNIFSKGINLDYDLDHPDKDYIDYLQNYKNLLIFFIINDFVTVLICGYYFIKLEKKWNTVPLSLDYIFCCVEIILRIVYVILKFTNNNKYYYVTYVTPSFSIIIAFFYFVITILLHQLARKINKFGVQPLGGMIINPGFTMTPGYRMNNPAGVGMTPGVILNNSGYVMNNPGYGMNNPGNPGMNNPGYGINNPGSGMNGSGFGTNNPGINNPGQETNNSAVVTNSPIVNDAGSEANNAGSEANNSGAEHV